MDIKDIPQDDSASYGGHRKVIYALNDGHYAKGVSSGWQAEAYATAQAVADLSERAQAAYAAVAAGTHSPVYYYMYRCRYELAHLAQVVGLFRWQVRRHFRPRGFAALSDAVLARYAAAFDVTPDALKHFPRADER